MSNIKVVLSSSMSFFDKIKKWRDKLEQNNFKVIFYPEKIEGDIAKGYRKEFKKCYSSIKETNKLVVLNFEKNGVPGYIGAGVFAEMAFALGIDRKVDVKYLNPISIEKLPYAEELKLWKKLEWISKFENMSDLCKK